MTRNLHHKGRNAITCTVAKFFFVPMGAAISTENTSQNTARDSIPDLSKFFQFRKIM
jgi:hypothetical protein